MQRWLVTGCMMMMAGSALAWDDTRRMTASPPICAAGVQCEVRVTPGFMAGQVTLDFSAKAEALAASSTTLRVVDAAGTVITEKGVGLMSDGRMTALLANGQLLPPGRYRYQIDRIAQGSFEVTSGTAAPSAASPAGSTPTSAATRAGGASGSNPANTTPGGTLRGVWYGIAGTPGSIELRADGSYLHNGQGGGRYRQMGNDLQVDGSLSAWNGGRATLKDGVIEFQWKNPQGFNNWFVFQRGN